MQSIPVSLFNPLYLSLFLLRIFYSVLPCSVSYDAISDAANMRDDYRYVASFTVPFPAPPDPLERQSSVVSLGIQ